ncbi:hypothetical protein PR048_016157, partial [Dryococelus australis]
MAEGSLVLVKDQKLGRIVKIHPGPDQTVHQVTFTRPAVKLCPLLLAQLLHCQENCCPSMNTEPVW